MENEEKALRLQCFSNRHNFHENVLAKDMITLVYPNEINNKNKNRRETSVFICCALSV